MKRRVLSLITALAVCLSLCPVQVWAADAGIDGLCPHHPRHTAECGYAPPAAGQECAHSHDDDCYITEASCTHEHTAECYSNPDYDPEADEPDLCTHACTQDSGCVIRTLSCSHEHDDGCGYAAQSPGQPCAYVCKICPIDSLIAELPRSVSAYNSEQVYAQLSEIYDLYEELTPDEQNQVDLSPCIALQDQAAGISAAVLTDSLPTPPAVMQLQELDKDRNYTAPYQISFAMSIDTKGYTLSGSNSTAIQVNSAGKLYLMGIVTSQKGAGVQVLSGGFLNVIGAGTVVTGTTYGLDIASGAEVQLSAGTYTGDSAAIRTADGDFAALLAPGCTYFDTSGNPILPADAAAAKTLTVGPCTNHIHGSYTHSSGATAHTWTCLICGTTGLENCTFDFDQNGNGTCVCGNSLSIAVSEDDLTNLVYDGTIKPEEIDITVALTDGSNKELVKDTDYTVHYEPRKDAGEITVTVTGITFNGTFTKTYNVEQDLPGIKWDAATEELDYDGRLTTIKDKLPHITITLQPNNNEDLHQYLQYSYRNVGDADFTDGLPLDAGTYEVKAYIPESQNYEYTETQQLLTLTIKAINPVITAPVAAEPTYNRSAQELVTPGVLDSRAVGAEILFAASQNGPYSSTVPTGTDAGDYEVWYKVEGTGNYNAVGPAEINGVRILRKPVTPIVTLSDYTYLYDGGYKQPGVTVKDEDDVTVLLDTEYAVAYVNNRNVSTAGNPAKAVVTDKAGGNYAINQVEVEFQITSRTQAALSITNQQNTVTYGDKFTLGTSGGSGDGGVTWEITAGADVATVGQASGQVTIIGHGSATVKATKSGKDPATGVVNYEDATASWTFTADKKPVVAVVTAEDKTYGDNGKTAVVHAVVEQGVLPGDSIDITGLTGEFDDENAGVDKTVTVDTDHPVISGTNSEHYDISFSSTTVKATIHKAIAEITSVSDAKNLAYNGAPQKLITGAAVDPSSVLVEYALSKDGPYSTDFPEGTNAGRYTVWYRVAETNNYTGLAPESVDVEIRKRSVVPAIKLDQDDFVYDGSAKEPAVTLKEADGTTLIPADEYTVDYSGNINVGTAVVTVTAKADGNYSFNPVEKNFTISKEKAQVLTAPKAAGEPLFYNTYPQKLVTEGTGSGGTMVYSTDNVNFTDQIPAKTNAGDYTVYYKVEGDGNHSDSDVGQVDVTIAPKTVKDPTIELFNDDGTPFVSCTYDGTAKKPTVVVKDGSTVIGTTEAATGVNDEYNVVYTDNVDAGRAAISITDKPGGNYTITGSTEFVIVKADIVFTTDPSDAGAVYNGKPQELLKPGVTSGGTVLYALGSATSTYTDAIPTAAEAGNYTVYYKVVGDNNHNDFAVKAVSATISRKPLTEITIELSSAGFEYDGTVKLPEITVKDGETVLPEKEYKWACDVASPTEVGTYTITITDAPGGNYDLTGVTANTAAFTIGRIAQAELVIDHSKAVTTNYGDTFTLAVTGGSGSGAVTLTVTDGPAQVNADGTVTITGVGEVTITAEKAADTNYLSAQAQWTFTAAPRPVTASVTVANKDYDGTTDATVSSASITALSGDTVTIDETSIKAAFDTPAVGIGKTVTLDASKVQVSGDAAKYAISYPGTVTANITQAATEITVDPEGIEQLEYNGEPQALVTAGRTNVGFIVYSLDGTNFSQEIPTGTNAGTYNVYYKVDSTTNYEGVDVNTAPLTVTIAPKPVAPKIELSESSFVYDGSKKEPKITVKDGQTVIDNDQYTIDWGGFDQTNVGTHTLTIQDKAGANYTFQTPNTAAITITPAPQPALSITGQPAHVCYGDTVTTLDTTGGSGNGAVTWRITAGGTNSSIDTDSGELLIKDTGSITVEAKRTVPNYETVTDTWTFTVEPKQVTAAVTIASKAYDGNTTISNGAITATVNNSDLVDPADSFTISGLTGAYADANAGTNKPVTLDKTGVTTTADPAKYTVSYPAVTADITPRQVDVTVTLSDHDLKTADDGSYYYAFDGNEKRPAVSVTADDNNAVLATSDYVVSYTDNKNVGSATVTVKSAADGNYTFTDVKVNFSIKPAVAWLTSSPLAKTLEYTGQMQELVTVGTAEGGHVEYALDGGAYSADIPKADRAGTYVVTYKAVGEGNYEDSTVIGSVSVTIKPKEIVSPKITVSGTYTYDGSPQEPGSNVKVEDGATLIPDTEYTLAYSNNINAGTATVHVINANGGDYIVNGTAAFTIDKGAAAVTAVPTGNENLPYNGTQQSLLATPGAASNGTMVYSLTEKGSYSPVIPAAKDKGTYTIWYKAQGDDNYNDSTPGKVEASIIVNDVKDPTVQVTPGSVTYNGQKQEPVVTVKDKNGFVIDGSEYGVTYVDENNNSDLISVGTYTVTIQNTSDSNYSINDSSAVFKILPAGQTPLTITNTREHVYYGDTIQLGTTGGNGTITWDVGGSTIAAIDSNGLLKINGVGSVTVTATSKAAGYTDQTAAWPIVVEKKPVTAVVKAEAKTYDGVTPAATTVTATLQSSDLVGSDKVVITLSGSFEDPNAGTDKKVNIDSTNPSFTGSSANYVNYNIAYPAATTASILKANIDATKVTPPTMKTGLEYTGDPQDLVAAGSSPEGTLEYSKDGGITYSASLPADTSAGDYDVWYRVKGDGNHNDMAGVSLGTVTIAPQDVASPIIEFTPSGASYDGAVHKPAVVVKDKNGRVIPDTEYTVAYGGTDWTKAGDHKVTVTDKAGGNYDFEEQDAVFTILMMGQNPLSILNQPGRVQYGDTFTLSAVGGSGTGAVQWQVTAGAGIAEIDQNGLVTVKKAGGPVTITATKLADGNYGSTTATWTFNVEKKPVTPIVTAKDREYDPNSTAAELIITWRPGDLLGSDTIDLDGILVGQFNDANVGNSKTVRIEVYGSLPNSDKYAITYPAATTASITPKTASVTAPTAINPDYSGKLQNLVNPGSAANGTIYYSLDGVSYSPNIPTGKNAGQYTVWYKAVADDENYKDSPAGKVTAAINPKEVKTPVIELSSETFDYDGTAKKPDVVVKDGSVVIPASEYTVSYSNNTSVGTATVTIIDADDGNYTVNGSKNFTIKAGDAVLTGAPQEKALTYNGYAQELVTEGTAVNGQVVYSLTGNANDYSTTVPTAANAGTYSVYYKVKGDNGAADTAARVVYVTIQPKAVTPVITLALDNDPMVYTGNALKPGVTVVVDGKPLSKDVDYTVTYSNNKNVGTATVTVQSVSGINYQFYGTAEFEIAKSKAAFLVEPKGLENLVYTGQPQQLIEEYTGISLEGTVLYSLNAVTYSAEIPTGTNVRKYVIYAKIQGNSTHEDSDPIAIPAEIGVNEVKNPTVELSETSFPYTGSEQKPTVTVTDDNGSLIQASEYTVSYSGNINVGTARVTVKSKGGNYSFEKTVDFQITGADQPALTITGKPEDKVYYGDTFSLSTTGGSGSGAVTWTISGPVDQISGGQFKVTNSGSVTITATKAASGGYGAATDTWTFYALPRPLAVTVTASDKPYDGQPAAPLTVIINSGPVSGDTFTITAMGHFTDTNVGTGKTVLIDSLTIPEEFSGKYTVANPGAATASITPAAAAVTGELKKADNLVYNGQQQALVSDTDCNVEGGDLAYSLDGISYSFNIPTGRDAGSYTVWYKVVAKENYKDSAPAKVEGIVIGANTDPPQALCTSDTFQYDGTEKTPTVVVRDAAGRIIPDSEYTVTFPSPRIAVGTYTVTVRDNPDGNYKFDTPVTAAFKIVAASQNPLSIITDKPADIYYGDTFRLSAMGGSGNGAIHWEIEQTGTVAQIDDNGVVTLKDVGGFTVKAYREAEGGYSQSNTASATFYVNPKPITPSVTADNKPYDGGKTATLHAAWKNGDLVNGDTIALTIGDGEFASEDVGANQQVTFQPGTATGADAGKYTITWPDSTTASIYKVDAAIGNKPSAANLTYDGNAHALLIGGSTVGGVGKIEYSLDQNGEYSENIPTAANAGTYTVWYKVADSVNYTGIPAAPVKVEIGKATPAIGTNPVASGTAGQKLSDIALSGGSAEIGGTAVPGTFAWADGTITPGVGTSQQAVIFTPDDAANYNAVTIQVDVTITEAAGGGGSGDNTGGTDTPDTNNTPAANTPSTPSSVNTAGTPMKTTIQNGTASTVVSAAEGSRLVREAAANQSQNVVIKPEITGDVTKAQVSIPASAVSQLQSETSADLTVSAPIADVTIPHAALDTLSRAGGTVNVTAEQVDQSVVMTLTADGKTVESVPGGVTLSVPVEDAAPGTVAVLVREDGTRETIRKSVVEDGKLSIPLDGSATVEIVDNSKEFTDVAPTSWEADAVAFASAHELFNGTSETTFSPDEAMSRGMLATVLYNLEGHPDQDQACTFSDVSGDAWYADSISWAAANGITNGYSDGQFGPNDSITREQFAVMLWRYAGSPGTNGGDLNFTDADQASGYALEALRWAAANGILNGHGNGQLDPCGTATRAQAAQMLKNFMENT